MKKHYIFGEFEDISAHFLKSFNEHGITWNEWLIGVAGEGNYIANVDASENQESELLWWLSNHGYNV